MHEVYGDAVVSMSNPTAVTYFSGGGFSAIGIRNAGYDLVGAVEFNPNPKYGSESVISEWYAKNVSTNVTCRSVIDVDPSEWIGVDLFQCSPPCPNFSVAKANKVETADDLAVAEACARFVRVCRPKLVVLENVGAYQGSESFRIFCNALEEHGYFIHFDLMDAKDFGVPQSRRRLILRAVWGGLVPSLHAPIKPYNGWYAAVEDLLPTCPESSFADWQLMRLIEPVRSMVLKKTDIRNFLHMTRNTQMDMPTGSGMCESDQPSNTVCVSTNHADRAFLISDDNQIRKPSVFAEYRPAMTLTVHNSGYRKCDVICAWLAENGRTVKMTSRCLARLQTLPDWYELPTKESLAGRIIGNAMPCLMMQRIAEGLKQSL